MHFYGATKKQRLFAKILATETLSDKNAYIKAGYSDGPSAESNAWALRKNPKVQALLAKYTAEDDFRTIATRREFMEMLTDMARPGATDFDQYGVIKPATNAMRLKAVEILNKMRGHEVTRTEISGPGGKPIEVKTKAKIDLSCLAEDEVLALEAMKLKVTIA